MATSDLIISVVTSSQFPIAGLTLSYLISIKNAGPDSAANVSLTTLLPSAFLNPEFQIGGNPSPWGSPYDIGTINAGQKIDVGLSGFIDPASAGQTLSLTASATSSSTDPNPANNSATITRVVGERADISIMKDVTSTVYNPGDAVRYFISYQNIGPSNSNDVTIEDSIPPELTNVQASINSGAAQAWNSPYSLGTLKPADSGYIIITGTLAPSAFGEISNTASIQSSTLDANLDDNAHTVTIEVTPSADVSVIKTASPASVKPNDVLTYSIVVKNAGPADAQNVVLADTVPDKLTNVEFSIDGGAHFAAWHSPYMMGTIGIGTSKTILIRGTVAASATETMQNTATVSTSTKDTDLTNNTSSTVTKLSCAPRYQAITDIIQSVALEQTALAHILNAEGEKIRNINAQDLVGLFTQTQLLNGRFDFTCNGHCSCDILAVNHSVRSMVNTIAQLELVLQNKLAMFEDCDPCKES